MSCCRRRRCCKRCCHPAISPVGRRIPRAVKLLLLGTVLALAAGPINTAGPAQNTNIINIGKNHEDCDCDCDYDRDCDRDCCC